MQNLIVDKDNAIIRYTYCTKPQDYYTDKDTQKIDEKLYYEVTKFVTYKYDLKTKETKELNNVKDYMIIRAYKDNWVYYVDYENNMAKNALFKMDINTEKTETVLTNNAIKNSWDGTTQTNVLANEILVADKKNRTEYFYDLAGNLKNTLKNTDWFAVNEYEDFYLLVDKNGYGIYNIKRFINKEDYIAGMKDYKVAGLPKASDNFNN